MKPMCRLSGENGNIFNLLAIAGRTLKDEGQRDKAQEMQERVMTTAESYDDALRIIYEYVDAY